MSAIACYRLNVYELYQPVHKQWNRHGQQLLHRVSVQQSARSSCQDWKTVIATEKPCNVEGHALSLSCGEVSCFIASNKHCLLFREPLLATEPRSSDRRTSVHLPSQTRSSQHPVNETSCKIRTVQMSAEGKIISHTTVSLVSSFPSLP